MPPTKKDNRSMAAKSQPSYDKTTLGFSLIELLVTIAIIAILATMTLPSQTGSVMRVQTNESIKLVERYKGEIEAFYQFTGDFPEENKDAGLPEPDKIIGHFISSVTLEKGALHLRFGNKANTKMVDKVVSIRPVYVLGSPKSPVSWVCGFDETPEGMKAAGDNKTSIPKNALPVNCR